MQQSDAIFDPPVTSAALAPRAVPGSTPGAAIPSAVAVLAAFGSLAATGLEQRTAALAGGAGAAVVGLFVLLGPWRGRPGGGLAVAALVVGLAGCALVPLLGWAGLQPAMASGSGTAPELSGAVQPAPHPSTESRTPQLVQVAPTGSEASKTAPDSTDGAGNLVSFDVANLVDGEPTTAWRTPGNGVGEYVVFTWETPVHLRQIGLIPGYDKHDPITGADRFRQNRRVRAALISFDGGGGGEVRFDPGDSTLQTFDVDAVTRKVTIQITSTTAAPRNFTAMSEVQFWAEP